MTKEEKEAIAKQKEYDSFRGPIEKPKSGSVREKQNALDNQMVSWFRNDRNNLAYTDDTKATPIEGEWEDFGESFHDPDDNIMNPIQGLGELNEIRAEDQGFWEKVGLGAAKMTTTAASTFLDGTVGFVWGVGSAIANRNASRLYDNDFTNAMQDFNEWCEDKMPHYSSKYEGWGLDFWGNFIGKDILQNLGFQIGTGLSMLVPGAGEAALGKAGLSITKTLAKFTTLKTARTMSNAFKDVITSTYAAIGESSIEALQNKRDFVKYQNQLNEDNFNKQNQQLDTEWARFVMQNYNGDERKASMSQEFLDYKNKKDELLRQKQNKDRFIQQEAEKVGDMTFMANMAIVGASNYLTFGKAVAGGMGLFKRSNTVTDIIDKETGEVLKKNVSKSTAKDVIKNGKYAAKDKETGEKILRNAMTKERGRTKSPLLNTIKDAVSEGLEEMNQSVASEWFSGAAEDDMLNYDALTRNGMAYDDVVKSINSSWMNYGNMARAFNKVYTDPSQWRQFFSGMIGVGFSPHFQKGSDGKVHFKFNNIGEQNAEINAYNSANAIIADNINNILNSEESQNYINGLVRHRALDEAKRGAVALDSKMDYQDADFAQFISDISMLSEAGKLDLFRAQLESVKNMSDEELEDYCTKLCNDVDGKKVGEFVDNKGNYIGTSDQARYDIRKKINGRVDQLLKDMETYQKSINEIDGKTGGVLNSKDLAVFAWEKANLTNKFERAKSILGSETSAKNLNLYKDKLGLALKNSTNQLKSLEHNLKVEKERVANANKMAEAVGKEKIDASDLQKELQEDIDNLTKNINIATEISQLIADLETMQVSSSESNPIDDVKKLFSKYEDFSESMPELAKVMELSDDKKVSLEALMYSGQLNKLLGWPTGTEVNNDEIDDDYRDAAKLFNRGVITEESLNDLIKNPERYSTGRAEMEQKILEHDNEDTIKAIEDEIKKAIDDGSISFGNIEERTNEIIDNLKSAKNEKNVGRRLFRNAVNMLRDTPFDSLRKIALENVLNSKKYQYLRDFAKFVNYVNVRIGMSQADPDALMIAQKTFTEFIKDKKTVEECLEAKIKLEDIDVSELYKDNYTPETYANAQLVQNEVFKMFETIFKDFAMDYYSPKLNIDKYDSGNILPNSEAVKANEVRKQIDKVKNKLTKYVDDFSGDILSAEDQENIFEHIDSVIEEEFGESNYEDPTNLELDSAKLELKTFMHKYLLDNANKRLTNLYDNKANDIEELKRNKEIIAKAKAKINKTIDSIGKNLKDDNTFNTDFDKLSEQDESIEVRDSKEGYYVEGGKVMRGYMAPCQVRLPGEESADIRYAIVFESNGKNKYWIYIIGNDGQRIGSLLVDKSEIDLNNLDFTNVEGVINLHDRLSLTDFATIKLLEKENQILNDQQYRLQNLREQASAEVLQENGTVDENGNVDVSQNLHNSTVTVNALMDDNITRSKSDIETIVESSRPASEQRLTIEYYAVYDYDNDQILRVQLPTNGKRIKIKEENGKTNEVKFSQSQYKKEGINGILKSIYGDNIEILQSSQEEWTGKKSEPKTQKKEETKPVAEKKVNVVNESNETDDFDYTTIFNLNDIDGSKVEVETISKPWKKDPSKKNRSMNIYLKGEKDKGYYQLVKDHEDGFYSVHFKTNNGQHTKTDVKPSTKEERAILYQQLINAIPEGGKVSTWGEISKGGIIALNKVGKDMKNVGTRTISLDDEAHTPVDIPIFEKTTVQKQQPKPAETPKQKAKKQAKQKAKNTASELSKQLAKLEQMEKDLEEAVKNNPDSDYADTLHSVRTFKNYVQLVRDNYEEMGRPEKVVIDANAIWSINNKLTENLKAIFGNDNVLVLSDEEIEKNITGNEQFSTSEGNKNENLTFNVIDKAIETGEWNQEALDELNNLITDIKDGKKEYRRYQLGIPRTIQQKGWRSDETAVKASIILRGSSDPSSTEQRLSKLQRRKRDQETGIRQEQIVESWARSEGLWFEQLSDSVKGLKLLSDKSSESAVYIDEAKRTVTKVMSLSHFINPQLAIDRIILHNQFFPKAPIKIIGFGIDKNEEFIKDVMNNNNKFRIVIEQPFAKGIKPTIENIKSVVENFGLIQQKTPTTYSNPLFIASDLHEGNAIHLVDDNDNPIYYENGEPVLAFIDTDMRLNTPDQGQNGEYHIDNSIVEIKESNSNDNQTELSKQNGEVFGYTADGKIVLNKDRIRLDTPVHEYTHLWDQAVQRINPEFWNQGKELMKQSAEWQKVINDPAYESIKDNEDLVASEVHSRLAGYVAAGKSVELYNHYKPNDKRNWFKRLIDWFMKFKDFTLKNIFNMSKADCKQVSLEQFLNAPVADFFMQTDPTKIGQSEVVVQQEINTIEKKDSKIEKSNNYFSQLEIEFALDILNDISYNDLVEKYKDTHLTKQEIVSGKYRVSDEAEFVLGKMLNRINPSFKAKQVKQATGVSMYGGDMKLIILEDENGKEYGSPQNAFWGFNRGLAKDYFKRFGLKDLQDLKTRIENINITEQATTDEPAPSEQVSDEQTIEEPVSEPEATTDTTDVYPIADTIKDKTKELDEQIPALPLNVENQEEREVFATIDAINEHNDPPVPLDTYRPAISRFPIGKNNDTRPFYTVPGKEGFEYIWNMYNALGAWDYVSQGKLRKDDDVYIGYGKVGENGKTVYEDVVFFVKDGDEYQMIGTLVNKNAPESANKLRNDIKRRYESGKQDMEKITVMAQKASGQFKSGEVFEFHLVKNDNKFLTTKPSKILNGRMQFTDTEYRSLKDVETPDGSKDFNIGFFTPDGLKDNMTVASQDSAKQFNSVNSKRNGHCVLILRKPDGDFQLVPLGVATLLEINKPGNQVANDFKEVVSDLYKLYTSDKSTVLKNNEIIDSLANGGIIARIGNIVHTDEFSLFANANNTITVDVNGKQYKNKRFDSLEQMQDFFEDIMKDCLICVNKNTLNNPDTVSKYVESNVFTTNLKTTEFANAFYTLAPIDSKGNALDYINDIHNETYLEENDIAKVLCKFGEKTFAVIDNFGNIKIGVKQFDEFNVSEANRKYSPEQRMRMISYALLKNGMQSNPNDTLFDDYYIDDDENEVSLLAHKTKYGDTIFYDTENFTTISPDRVSYKDGEGNKIKFVKKDEKETESVDDEEDFETLDEDEDIIELDDDEEIIELDDDDEEIEVDDEDDDSEEIDNDESDDEIEVDDEESQQEDSNKKNVDLFMSKDFAKNFWKISEHPCFEDKDDPQRETVLLINDFITMPEMRQDLIDTIGEDAVNTIDKMLEKYDADLFYDYTDLFMSNGNKDFDKSFERISEEAIQKILKKHSLIKEDPTKLLKKKDDNCSL